MTPRISRDSPARSDLAQLFVASDAFSAALYPPESNHGVSPAWLARSGVTFLVARIAGAAVGCGALVQQRDGWAELKRMFVAEAARGTGVGRALLAALEEAAIEQRAFVVRLETGVRFESALRLYRRAGYREREPFGAYRPDPLSVFMEKRLTPRA